MYTYKQQTANTTVEKNANTNIYKHIYFFREKKSQIQ